MPIDTRAQSLLGIVHVQDFDPLAADGRFDLLDELAVLSPSKIITSGKKVGGIETNTQSFRFFHLVHDRSEVLELVTQRASLPGGDFQAGDRFRLGKMCMNDIERGDDPLQTLLFAHAHVSARVSHQKGDAKQIAAGNFFDK